MHTAFIFQKPVGVIARDLERRGAQAGLVAVLPIQRFHRVALAFRPAAVHAAEHLRPVAGFRATRPCGNDEETRRNIARLIEQGQQFVGTNISLQALRIGQRLARQIGVVEFLRQRNAFFDVRHSRFELQKRFEFFLQSRRF